MALPSINIPIVILLLAHSRQNHIFNYRNICFVYVLCSEHHAYEWKRKSNRIRYTRYRCPVMQRPSAATSPINSLVRIKRMVTMLMWTTIVRYSMFVCQSPLRMVANECIAGVSFVRNRLFSVRYITITTQIHNTQWRIARWIVYW